MSLLGPQNAHREAGTLRLSVQYLGDEPDHSGESRSRFSWRAESVDPDLPGSYANHHLYAPLGAQVTANEALRVAASRLVEAAKQFRFGIPLDSRYPVWLFATAYRNIGELSTLAAASDRGPAGQGVEEQQLPTPSDLLAVEVARALLRGGPNIINAEILDVEDLAELREVTAQANREVVVPDPDDPFGPPLYEGPAADAYIRLAPGMYPALGLNGDDNLAVIVDRSPLSRAGMASAAFTATEPTNDADRVGRSSSRAETRSSTTRDGHSAQWPQHPFTAQSSPSRGTDRQMPPSLGL